jgi:hypothetical protein
LAESETDPLTEAAKDGTFDAAFDGVLDAWNDDGIPLFQSVSVIIMLSCCDRVLIIGRPRQRTDEPGGIHEKAP